MNSDGCIEDCVCRYLKIIYIECMLQKSYINKNNSSIFSKSPVFELKLILNYRRKRAPCGCVILKAQNKYFHWCLIYFAKTCDKFLPACLRNVSGDYSGGQEVSGTFQLFPSVFRIVLRAFRGVTEGFRGPQGISIYLGDT